jgi:hypothetical protein
LSFRTRELLRVDTTYPNRVLIILILVFLLLVFFLFITFLFTHVVDIFVARIGLLRIIALDLWILCS